MVGKHLAGTVEVAAAIAKAGSIGDRVHSAGDTLALIRDAPSGRAIYQPSFAPPPRFYQRYGLDHAVIEFRENRPVRTSDASGRLQLLVVDIKASDALKTTASSREAEGLQRRQERAFELVKELRPERPRPVVRFEGLPGEFSQHDFGQVEVPAAVQRAATARATATGSIPGMSDVRGGLQSIYAFVDSPKVDSSTP